MKSKNFELNNLEERIEIFKDYFDRDVESYFTSSVACCDNCFDDFKEEWPGTVARDEELSAGGIDMATFLANGRIREAFYQEEIAAFSQHLLCPNCSSVLTGNFWIYEHPFSIPQEYSIRQISELAGRSPFLLLSHPFAKRVFNTILALGNAATAQKLPLPLYRARTLPESYQAALSDFGPPPSSKVAEGRYNHAGHSMLYVAESQATAMAETCGDAAGLQIAELELPGDLKVLDLSITRDVDNETQEVIQCVARSALCAAPRASEGWDRPEYVFSRFVGDCARHAVFGAIRYGSVKDSSGANLVILEPHETFAHAILKAIHKTGGNESAVAAN